MNIRVQRTPDELLAVLDQAQERLGKDFDLRDLMWEIFTDLQLTLDAIAEMVETPAEVILSFEDYLVNHYGDD